MYDRFVVKLEDGTVGYCEFAEIGKNAVILVRDEKGHHMQKRGKIKEIVEHKEYKLNVL